MVLKSPLLFINLKYNFKKMGKKQQISFKVDSDVITEFDNTLNEFKEVTGMKPIRQEAIEVAMKDYILKVRKQIKTLKGI